MIFNMVSGGGGSQPTPPGSYPSLFVTGLEETDTCTATCNGKTFNGVWTSKGRLPSAYQEVEYIESSGTQYIDTGIIPTSNTRVVADVSGLTGNINGSLWESYSTSDDEYGLLNVSAYPTFRSDYGSSEVNKNIAISSNTVYHIDMNKNVTTINGEAMTNTASTFSGNKSLYVFARNANGNVDLKHPNAKFHSMEIYENNTQLRNFIPCYRKSDNEIGMYDTVSDTFFTNQGTGAFTKGADINTSGFLFSNLTELGTYTVSDGTSTMEILIDAPIEYLLEWSTIPRGSV